jgi:hypothetical protein
MFTDQSTNDMIMSQVCLVLPDFHQLQPILGEVQNKGFEISLNTLNIKNPNFEWTTLGCFFIQQNTINALYGNMEDVKDGNGNVVGTKEVMIQN